MLQDPLLIVAATGKASDADHQYDKHHKTGEGGDDE